MFYCAALKHSGNDSILGKTKEGHDMLCLIDARINRKFKFIIYMKKKSAYIVAMSYITLRQFAESYPRQWWDDFLLINVS